jgi:hypothetical protein
MFSQNQHLSLSSFLRRTLSAIFLLPAVLMLVCANALYGQETFIQSPSKLITSFPVTLFTGGVILMRAQLDNFPDSLNFILDTGSGGISLDSTTCLRMHMTPQLSDKTILGIAGIRQVKFLYNKQLRLPGLTVDSLNFHVSDYDILSSVYGEKIDGIIGYSFFTRYIVSINYDSLRVYIYSRGTFRYPKGGFILRPLIPNLPIVNTETQDAKQKINGRFYFDTGAGLCALFSSDFVNDSSLMDKRKNYYLTQAQGLGGKAEMRLTTVKEVKLGPYRFRQVPVYVFDDIYNVTSYPNLCGLVGNDILRRFNVILNYDRRCIYLTPNSHYHDLFDYSYTGLTIYWEDGIIRIGDIMPGSPAEKAGLKVDDILLGINTNFTNNIQAYRTLLQSPGDKLKMVVRRNNELLPLILKVKSIR